jgi:hypothetical protein
MPKDPYSSRVWTQTRVYRESPDGITATVVTLSADGKSSTVEYPVNYDGLAHPVTGSTDIDAIKMVKITSYRAESTLMHAGRVIASTAREVSGDQKTITYYVRRRSSGRWSDSQCLGI